ncbi:MAG: hypothetical protein JWR25_2253 [Noviherbaspirillum sp.]|nr:hypothetical protein [Noviherbaspirillum sp.]
MTRLEKNENIKTTINNEAKERYEIKTEADGAMEELRTIIWVKNNEVLEV